MIASVFDIDVKINNESVPTETVADLKQLYEDLGQFLKWLDEAPRFGKLQVNKSTNAKPVDSQVSEPNPQTEGIEASKTSLVEPFGKNLTTTQYAILALGLHDGTAQSIDAMHTAKELGWSTRAKDERNAKRTFEIMTRQNQHLVTLERGIMRLTHAGWEEYQELKAPLLGKAPALTPAISETHSEADTADTLDVDDLDLDEALLHDEEIAAVTQT